MKKILLAMLMSSFCFPAFAKHDTQPNDKVGVLYFVAKKNSGPEMKRYTKLWKQIKLDKSTHQVLHTTVDKINEYKYQKYRVGFIRLANDDLQAATFYGDHGGVITVMFGPKGKIEQSCHLIIDGNGFSMGGCKQGP